MSEQRTFNGQGMLSAAPKQTTPAPGVISVGGSKGIKPGKNYVIGNKVRDEAIKAQKDDLAFQKAQLAEQKRQFELTYKMQQASPNKIFIEAPTGGNGAHCRSCGHCPWMAMNTLDSLEQSLLAETNEILVDEQIIQRARIPLQRMLDFSQQG